MRRVLLVVDGPAAGLGHLKRSAVLGRALVTAGASVELAVVGAQPPPSLSGVRVSRWPTTEPADVVVIDSYRLTSDEVRERARPRLLARVDDLGGSVDAELIVNPNGYASPGDYDTDAVVLAGLPYLLIDAAFVRLRDVPATGGILVSFGGTDRGERAAPVVRALRDAGHVGAVVVAVAQRGAELSGVEADVRVGEDLVDLYEGVSVFVGTASTAAYEAAAAGRSIVVTAIAENQNLNLAFLARRGVATAPNASHDLGRLAAAAASAPAGNPLAAEIDGRGAERAAAALLASLEMCAD